jgi:DNA-binding response OmpR family regulator
MNEPRVLLVEDDPSLQRFVELALEGMPLALRCCATVAEAIVLLRSDRYALIITDLLLPDASGRDLLARLQQEPELRGSARCAVFSAGLDDAAKRTELMALGAWRLLSKPCSLDELESLVNEALQGAVAAAPALRATADPVLSHFGGNEALFRAFRASCLQQFEHDLTLGDAACSASDAPALQRLAHSLKSVLLSLGHEHESQLARQLESLAELGQLEAAQPLWTRLSHALRQLRQAGDTRQ